MRTTEATKLSNFQKAILAEIEVLLADKESVSILHYCHLVWIRDRILDSSPNAKQPAHP